MLRGMTRGGRSLPVGVERRLWSAATPCMSPGPRCNVEKLAPIVGRKISAERRQRPRCTGYRDLYRGVGRSRDHVSHRGLRISLGTSVGTLLAGLAVGWARSTRPWFARIPDAAILFMRSIGLAAFVAMIGLKAGPIFVSAVKESGYLLFARRNRGDARPSDFGHFVWAVCPSARPGSIARRSCRRADHDRGGRSGPGESPTAPSPRLAIRIPLRSDTSC